MRGNRTQCRIFKRCLVKCLVIFAAISLLPFALIYLISTDQINRIKNYDVSIFILFHIFSLPQPTDNVAILSKFGTRTITL